MKEALEKNLLRADMYRVLALGFDTPTAKQQEEIRGVASDYPNLQKWIRSFDEVGFDQISFEYNRLFLTSVAVPCQEGSYQLAERGPILGDITAFYQAFGLKFQPKEGPPDSLKMELGFLSFMALKEAHALSKNMTQEAQTTCEAQKKFLQDHLCRWGETFADRLFTESRLDYYKILSKLLGDWLREENALLLS